MRGGHEHRRLLENRAYKAQVYSSLLCKAIVRAINHQLHCDKRDWDRKSLSHMDFRCCPNGCDCGGSAIRDGLCGDIDMGCGLGSLGTSSGHSPGHDAHSRPIAPNHPSRSVITTTTDHTRAPEPYCQTTAPTPLPGRCSEPGDSETAESEHARCSPTRAGNRYHHRRSRLYHHDYIASAIS